MDLFTSPDEQSRVTLYQAIGEATTAWAGIEYELVALFVHFVAGRGEGIDAALHSEAARAAFHAVINFNSRLAMVNRAAEWAIMFGEHLPRWRALHKRLKNQAKLRNDIVHFSLILSGQIPGGPMEYYLSPSLQNVTIHLSGKDPPKLNAADVRRRTASFRELAKDLLDFAVSVGARALPQSPELASDSAPA